jgi:hypothetical protein
MIKTGPDFIQEFENGSVSGESFHHADHVRLAFAYLGEYPLLEALQRFCLGLRRFAVAHGKPQLYHETITYAYFFVISERMARQEVATRQTSWEEFAATNPDLLIWEGGILSRYYRESTLQSALARRAFILPDKLA